MRVIIEHDYQSLSEWAANYVVKESISSSHLPNVLLYWVCLRALPHWACIRR